MKSWADHCSSDEESFNEDTPMDAFDNDEDDGNGKQAAATTADHPAEIITTGMDHLKGPSAAGMEAQQPPHQERTYDLPSGPPFTLYVGNLAYSIKDGNQLGEALANVVKERLHKDIRVVKSRVAMDRDNGGGIKNTHKGYGYVEVASLDEVSCSAVVVGTKSLVFKLYSTSS